MTAQPYEALPAPTVASSSPSTSSAFTVASSTPGIPSFSTSAAPAPSPCESTTMPSLPAVPFDHAWALLRDQTVIASSGNTRVMYPLASVTKLLATWASLIAVSRGFASLEDQAGPTGATLRHLLSHASGLPLDSSVPQLPPEQRRIYSNAGIEVACAHIEACTRVDTSSWIDQTVLTPLGMSTSSVDASPAHSGRSSVDDLVRFVQELLSPRLVSPDVSDEAFRPQYPHLAGVVPGYGRHNPCPWGLGVEIRGTKAPHWTAPSASASTFGHFGVSGSFLWVDPEAHLAAVFLGSEPFGPWHKEHWSQFNEALRIFGINYST
ncbi:serine hydrolase domain-containing protein [Schaalia suimastitidis]|uniref:serine hydrolase domain-containing protein n=1 Tax=Schaalia suimastitidis TaxID=121163 RepID=UPI00040B2879|nr:serine hydrolase domain-containing protein [Schaalia suimastitidis]